MEKTKASHEFCIDCTSSVPVKVLQSSPPFPISSDINLRKEEAHFEGDISYLWFLHAYKMGMWYEIKLEILAHNNVQIDTCDMRTYNNTKNFMNLLINVSIYVKLTWMEIIRVSKKCSVISIHFDIPET